MPGISVNNKKPIMLITEGQTDASIIRSLIDAHGRKVYMVVSGGYQNIASMVRTQYLIHGDTFYYVAINICQLVQVFHLKERICR